MTGTCPQCGRELAVEIKVRDGRWDAITHAVAQRVGMSMEELRGPGRSRRLVHVRRLVARVLRVRGATLKEVGGVLGGRDHTTVMNLMRKPVPGYLEDLLIEMSLFHDRPDEAQVQPELKVDGDVDGDAA